MTRNETIQVLVFQTNISRKKDVHKAGKALDDNCNILTWNIDTEDIDNVLRVETDGLAAKDIIEIIINEGFICKELQD